jgi:ubiquinone/menaquinone biosynthesis C-methylase UbiE
MTSLTQTRTTTGQWWLAAVYAWACDRFPGFRKLSRHVMYQLMARFVRRRDWTFMNYGFAPAQELDGDAANPTLALDPEDEPNRYCIQLYHHVAGGAELKGRRVLEVGSGRGGGAHFIKRYHAPAEMVGVDFSKQAVALCRRRYDLPGLIFDHGDAEALPFDDGSFDAVINVESSHCYRSMPTFLQEIARVLRPGGHFLFTDFRQNGEIDTLHRQIAASELEVVTVQDITRNVVRAIDTDNTRKLAQIRGNAPRWLANLMEEFAGTPGSRIYNEFLDGDATYVGYTLRKPTESAQ